MLYRAGRRCPVIEGPRPRLGVADELRDRIHRQRWVHDQDEWRGSDESDRHEVPGHVEGNIRVQAAYRGDGTARHHEGVTIRLRLDNQTDAHAPSYGGAALPLQGMRPRRRMQCPRLIQRHASRLADVLIPQAGTLFTARG